ncbi:MAG: succinylglutamate desuccinylase/aspartoacylase family protein [Blastocatellia bacterium]|nr:succinylglutamate desuccinylase/aspartoacylase family protein [Blastocatellia bacterium]
MNDHSNADAEHVIARFAGDESGPTLIVFGSLHGNEAAGVAALRRVAAVVEERDLLLRGRVYFLAGNMRAVATGVRFIDADLNRHWSGANVIRNLPDTAIPPQLAEDREQAELLKVLVPLLATARDEVYAIDLHSTSAEGVPFATMGDTLRNRAFAQKFPITVLLGIEEQLEGTLLEYLNNLGVVTLGFEGGQHYADSTVGTHAALVTLALVHSGIASAAELPVDEAEATLAKATGRKRIVEVRYRQGIEEGDVFAMRPGFENFDTVKRGLVLATQNGLEVQAPETGLVLMPLYQKLGEDGFFIGREVAPFWIWLSGVLRRLRVGDLMPILPGVRRSEKNADVLEIDTTVARYFPMQIFHLLGFRKLRWTEGQLVVSRRKFDRKGPFG